MLYICHHFYHVALHQFAIYVILINMAKSKTVVKPKTAPKRKAVKPAVSTASTPKQIKAQKPKETAPPPIVRYCSLCGKSSETRKRLIAGPNNIFICDECIEVSVAILLDVDKEEWALRIENILTGKKKFKIEDVKTKPPQKKGKKTNA